jgi:gamma-D-glutamyl-L-lysine dipeptidyl-peptidase
LNTGKEIVGICHLSVIPIRVEPSDKAEIGSQLLFGELFTSSKVTEDNKWMYIQTEFDDYLGWIDTKQFKEVSKEFYDTYRNNPSPLSNGLMGLVKGEKEVFPVLMGSTLPLLKNNCIRLGDDYYEYEGEYSYPQRTDASFIEKTARYYLRSPYLWGGKTHFGIDCSGFVQQVYKLNGYALPRDSFQQAEIGQLISFEDRMPGDLAFFTNVLGRVIHVGIVLPSNRIIHASGEVRIDKLEENGIFKEEKAIYTHKLASIRRIIR